MPDRHKRKPLSLRLAEDLERWLRDHAAATGRPVRAVIADALREYRERHETVKAIPAPVQEAS